MYSTPSTMYSSLAPQPAKTATVIPSRFQPSEDFGSWLERNKGIFPTVFTFAMLAVCCGPFILGMSIHNEASVRYWLGSTSSLMLIAPIFVILGHVVHMFKGRPIFLVVLLSTIVPPLLFVFVAETLSGGANGVVNQLASTDCTTYSGKYHVEKAYQSASAIFDTCVDRVAKQTRQRSEKARSQIALGDCSEYYAASNARKEFGVAWAYLEALELRDGCSGWCTASPSLFNPKHGEGDLCSTTASSALHGPVARSMQRMLAYAVVLLVTNVVCVWIMSSLFIKMNISW